MSKQKPPFIVVDGSSYLFRAFHALPPLTNSKGVPTGAMYGVINMLKRIIKDYEPEHMAVVFDAKGKTFRHDLYPEYKANRPPMDEDLRVQIAPLHEAVKALGLSLIMIEGVEADDVIGTLAKQAEAAGMQTLISTGDKDMAQLVNAHTTLINTMDNKTYDTDAVVAKFGVPPEKIIDYLTLIGDKVDNVPGVEKVGPKTAVKWLEAYGCLDSIMANAGEVKGKVGENLRTALPQLPLSRDLVTIKCDVALDFGPEQLNLQTPNKEALTEIFKEYEFKTWLKELLSEAQAETVKHYETVLTEAALKKWLGKIKKAELVAFDTETTAIDEMQAELVGVSFAVKAHEAAYIPCAHDYEGAPEQLSRETLLAHIKPILEDPNIKKVGQNLKYDMTVMARAGIQLRGVAFDTMLESYVLDSTANRHDMDTLALKYLGVETISFETVAGKKGPKQLTFNQVPLEQAAPYAAEDADITLQLHQALWPKFSDKKGQQSVFHDIEVPLISVLSYMEQQGVLVDCDKLNAQSTALGKRIEALEKEAFDIADCEFNLSSPKQLQSILFEKIGLPIIKKTPKGQPSTAEEVLHELAYDYPLPKIIIEHRSLSKLKSTYTDKLPLQVNPKTGRIHTSYHQAVAATGRLSSSEPNLQNIPVRTEQGRLIRQAFIAKPGHKIIAADYSQIELRIMAHLSQDKSLLAAFDQGLDIHQATAAEVFDCTLEEVTPEQRRSAKAINFGLIYGMSSFGLAKQLETDRESAQAYMDVYFERYPGVKAYMEDIRHQAHEKGYVETLFGRRLYLPEINAKNMMRQKAAERTAVNAPMQGTAADIIKKAMLTCHHWLTENGITGSMIMQVHDELIFEVVAEDVEKTLPKIESAMMGAAKLDVPLIVGMGIGDNWDEAH